MENQKNDNLNLLEAVVQNTEMGKNTLEQILPMTSDVQFKAELLRQRNIYHQLNQEAHTAIEACGGSAQGQSTMAKLNTKMGIGLKTLTDKSTRNLLGKDKELWTRYGLKPDWVISTVKSLGNFGEMYENNLGNGSEFKIERDKNYLIDRGGLIAPESFL